MPKISIEHIIQDFFSDDKDLIIYRPALRSITKSIGSAILLSQIMYWDKDCRKKGKTEFYKFNTPPKKGHPKYKKGDSWCEELNVTPDEFSSALKNIGCKYSQKVPKNPNCFVWFRIDTTRLTHYSINAKYLQKALLSLYVPKNR